MTMVTETTMGARDAGGVARWAHLTGVPGWLLSIRSKGLLVICALIVYAILIAMFAFGQKRVLLQDFEQIQEALKTESVLKQADLTAFNAVVSLFAAIDAPNMPQALQHVEMHHQALRDIQGELAARLPEDVTDADLLEDDWERALRVPSKENLNRLVAEEITVKNERSALMERVQKERQALSASYRQRTDSVAAMLFVLGMLGLALLGAAMLLFFRGLTDDLGILQSRALEILHGFHGDPIEVTRHDEVGQLMVAVNNMSDTLEQRNKELMLERQKYFHQEKMAAIGTLAAGISHEIGNPIAAISGIAQEMIERRENSCLQQGSESCRDCRPDMIHVQIERLAAITREIAEFASPRPIEPQLLDLNNQLRSTSSLVRYDQRLQGVSLRLRLDSQLPAIYGMADQLTQLIMNLLINAMDALEGVSGRTPTITITTSVETRPAAQGGAQRACLLIEDNGHGIDRATQSRVFEAFFTTKPAGKGTGLGLSLCYSIAQKHGGGIELDSTPGQGTRVRVWFPLDEVRYAGEVMCA